MDYETGAVLALLVGLGKLVFGIGLSASTFASNMRKVGLRRSLATGTFKRGGAWWWEIPLALFVSLIWMALSWIGVTIELAYSGYQLIKGMGAPQKMRELRWQLRNIEMSAADVMLILIRFDEVLLGRPLTPEEIDEEERATMDECREIDPHLVEVAQVAFRRYRHLVEPVEPNHVGNSSRGTGT